MTGRSTITMTLRLSPELKADFARIMRARGKSLNGSIVDLMREEVVQERNIGDGKNRWHGQSGRYIDTTTHSAKEE